MLKLLVDNRWKQWYIVSTEIYHWGGYGMGDIFYSIQEAAEILKVDYKVVYRLVKEGRIPSQRVGWQFRISQDDMNGYLKAERLKQNVVAETMRSASAAAGTGVGAGNAAPPRVDYAPPANGAAAAGEEKGGAPAAKGVSRMRVRQMEMNFVNRFSEKVAQVDVLRHPLTRELVRVEDWKAIETLEEDREALMQALNTAFLDRRTLAVTPRNTVVRYTLPGKAGLVLEGKLLAHLETLCRAGADDAPATLEDLLVEIDAYEARQRATRGVFIVGLASPTGWEQAALSYIGNPGRGDGYRNANVKFLLIDLLTGAVCYDEADAVAPGYAGLFAMATDQENVDTLTEQLRTAMEGRTGLMLSEYGQELGVSEELLLEAARRLESEGPFRVIPDREQGWIFVRV